MSTKEKVYAWLMLVVGLILLGSSGAVETNLISFKQGLIQIASCVMTGLILSYLIWREETKSARRRG